MVTEVTTRRVEDECAPLEFRKVFLFPLGLCVISTAATVAALLGGYYFFSFVPAMLVVVSGSEIVRAMSGARARKIERFWCFHETGIEEFSVYDGVQSSMRTGWEYEDVVRIEVSGRSLAVFVTGKRDEERIGAEIALAEFSSDVDVESALRLAEQASVKVTRL